MRFIHVEELKNGMYFAKIGEVKEVTKQNGETKVKITLIPVTKDGDSYGCESAEKWFDDEELDTGLLFKLFKILKIKIKLGKDYSEGKLQKLLEGKMVGMEIKINVKDGESYKNVVDFCKPSELMEGSEDGEDDEFEDDEEDEDIGDEDDEEEEDDELEEDEDDELEEEDEDDDDEEEDFDNDSMTKGRSYSSNSWRRK